MGAETIQLDTLVAKADALRDQRRFAGAAEAYRNALVIAPGRCDLWVQLGNMLKDDGRYGEAEAAYCSALALDPKNADTHLQLGRALKLDRRQEAALAAFTTALELAPASRDVIGEVISLGQAWQMERQTGLGHTLALSVTETLDALKDAIARIERDLPALKALSAIPSEHYGIYRRLYRVPPPDHGAGAARVGLAMFGDADLPALLECLQAIKAQTHTAVRALLPCLGREGRAAVEAAAAQAPHRYATASGSAPSQTLSEGIALALSAFGNEDWILLVKEPVLLDPEAAAWIASEGQRTGAVAVYADEDVSLSAPTGPRPRKHPSLRGSFDAELIRQGYDLGTLLAVRREALEAAFGRIEAGTREDASVWFRLAEEVSALGPVAHVPEVLVSRFSELAGGEAGPPPVPLPARARQCRDTATPAVRDRIDVVIPTRNGLEHLSRCIASLIATAGDVRSLTFTIADNGSDDPETRAWLDAGKAERRFSVLTVNEPFNWSRINNLAAAATSAPLLLFLNNDVEMLSYGWDDLLRQHLARPEVGVVGARLIYPDKTLQHAGIVVGMNGATEHEGRGAPMDAPGPLGRWQTRRSVSAVTGACLACRREEFNALGGFDAGDLGIWFSDVDLCLKTSAAGRRVLYEPAILALHHEAKSIALAFEAPVRSAGYEHAAALMRARWGRRLEADPWYHPHYARFGSPYAYLKG